MRLPNLAAAALPALLLLASLPVHAESTADGAAGPAVRIAELLANPDPASGQREFIELWNPGDTPVDLAGWTIRDAATASGSSNEFTFASRQLGAGQRVVVWSNGSTDARGPSWSSSPSKAVWNDGGDAATLLDPAGNVADWFAYGSATAAAPPGFNLTKPAAAPRGSSLALVDAAWRTGTPTPALAPGAVGGFAGATVANVAPTAVLHGVPATVKPGTAVRVEAEVGDANGAADVAAWTLEVNGATVAGGSGAGAHAYDAVAPAVSGPWAFRLTVTDAGGLRAEHVANATVRDARLALELAGGILRFPELRPGQGAVTALDWATLRNEGADAVTPLLDVSPFAGPQALPVDGRLSIGVDAGNGTAWRAYAGPLTPLPSVPPGGTLRMTLRLDDVPLPLAAGAYGTTFAVVAA